MISFRAPRLCSRIGMRMVSVSTSGVHLNRHWTVASFMVLRGSGSMSRQSSLARQLLTRRAHIPRTPGISRPPDMRLNQVVGLVLSG
jgi:hypothetical protein